MSFFYIYHLFIPMLFFCVLQINFVYYPFFINKYLKFQIVDFKKWQQSTVTLKKQMGKILKILYLTKATTKKQKNIIKKT